MSIIDDFIGYFAPHTCLVCGVEGQVFCDTCTGSLRAIPERCYSCKRSSAGFLTCARCRVTSRLHSVKVGMAYEGGAKALIWRLKLGGAQAAAKIMARYLSKLIERNQRAIIIPVPTATGRQRRRGYDQAKLLAREVARQTRLPYNDCLRRHGQTHQHGLSRDQRLKQLSSAFRVVRPKTIQGGCVILVDDVVTTGSTLEAAAAVLQAAGARRVCAVVFAQP